MPGASRCLSRRHRLCCRRAELRRRSAAVQPRAEVGLGAALGLAAGAHELSVHLWCPQCICGAAPCWEPPLISCHKRCPLPQQQDGSGSGGRDADDLPLPEVPKQRRRRRKPEQQPKEFTIDDLNPISSAWAGCMWAKNGQQPRGRGSPNVHWAAARRPARCCRCRPN